MRGTDDDDDDDTCQASPGDYNGILRSWRMKDEVLVFEE